jgi:hypothetical protein
MRTASDLERIRGQLRLVLNALPRIAVMAEWDAHIVEMVGIWGFWRCRPFIHTAMLETSLLL